MATRPRRAYAERPKDDLRHQWVFMLMFEISPAKARAAQALLDEGKLPDPAGMHGSMLDVPNVFCWRCLQRFDPRISRTPCRGDPRRHTVRQESLET